LKVAYTIGWSGAETETHVFKMVANFREKRTSITTMKAKIQAFAIFLTPHISLYPLPLKRDYLEIFSHSVYPRATESV
jgi:hypothetical protein